MTDYLENTFGLEDIFAPKTVIALQNTSVFRVKEVKTLNNGRVFAICPVMFYKVLDRIVLEILRNREFHLSIFYPGEEFWFVFPRFPVVASFSIIDTQKMRSADIAVAEQRKKFLMKNINSCTEYDDGGFATCAKNVLKENFDKQLDCLLPGFEETVNPNSGEYSLGLSCKFIRS